MIDRRMFLGALAGTPLAVAMTSCATLTGGDGRELRLVCFNIWHNQGDWAARLPLLVDAIRAADPDVIALQEVLEDAAVGPIRRGPSPTPWAAMRCISSRPIRRMRPGATATRS